MITARGAGVLDIEKFAERYVRVWNEPDPLARREAVTGIWPADAVACTPGAEYRGLRAIEARVASAYEKWVGQEGYLFRAREAADSHHDGVRLAWEMVPAAGGPAVPAGVQFLLLDDDGRVRCDYQFIDA